MKKTIKAWAVIYNDDKRIGFAFSRNGQFPYAIYPRKKDAGKRLLSKVVPCTITYETIPLSK